MKILLGGEGPDELGGWFPEPPYRRPDAGVLEAILRRVCAEGWSIADAVPWKNIRKFAVTKGLHKAEVRNVLGLALHASERGIDVVAFSRDRDGDPDRERDLADACEESRKRFPNVRLIGGVAIEAMDAWILALRGERRSEEHPRPKNKLAAEHQITATREKVLAVEDASFDEIPEDATSLHAWISSARAILG